MTKRRQKLELTWIGKDSRPKLEPRILIEDPEKSYHAPQRVSENDIFDNRLIFGDNLLALKALEQEFAGMVKCIFIDPPYNTSSAFEHYDDGIEHSLWLSLMRDRLNLIWRLLSEEGSLWITIDDNEAHYLKVLCDEVFGRNNFVNNVIWQKKYSPQNDATWLSDNHDHILIYAKNKAIWRPNLLPRSEEMNKRYKNPDNDFRGNWKPGDLSVKTYNINNDYPITTPSGRVVNPPKGYCWRVSKAKLEELIHDNRIWFGPKGKSVPAIKRFLTDVKQGVTPMTIWLYRDVGHNQDAKKEVKQFNNHSVFDTPKPEKLMQRIIQMASNPGDLVLDSFAGSGTTGAVAHKMGRHWIMIELGEHCHTHIIPRLKKVINGEDLGGISVTRKTKELVKLCPICKDSLCEKCADKIGANSKGGIQKWFGGGGFRYYKVGPSLIVKDAWGNPIINTEFKAEMLAEAMCKIEGFTYGPSEDTYWIHGKSTESDFIYVTTQFMSKDMLTKISDEVGPDRSLLICCSAFRCNPNQFSNLTLKKIPKAVLSKCEWGHDDYSLEIKNLPEAPAMTETVDEEIEPTTKPRKFGKDKSSQESLFDMGGDK